MRVLVGQLVLEARPDLESHLRNLGEFATFDPWMMTSEVVGTIDSFRPDVVLVQRMMVDVSFLLNAYLHQGGVPNCQVVIGAVPITNVDKIEAARAGFADVVDLGGDAVQICARLQSVFEGRAPMVDDPLWKSVSRPVRFEDLQVTPRDSTDDEILRLIAIGLSDLEIAEAVYMSAQTIRNRVSQMLIRSGLSNRTQMGWVYTHQNLLNRVMLGVERRPRPT